MSQAVGFISVLLTVWCMLTGSAVAQQVSCGTATSMQNVNITEFVGTWFEVARNPNVTNIGCVEIDLGVLADNTILNINVTYVDPQTTVWQNLTLTTNLTLDSSNTNGYNVSFSEDNNSQPLRTLKLLQTDYTNYAFVCGYTDASNESTVFGVILTRLRMPSASNLSTYEQLANKTYSDFNDMSVITQSEKCYRSAASMPLPMIVTVIAGICALLKYIY